MKYYHNCSNLIKGIVFICLLVMLILSSCSSNDPIENTEQVKAGIRERSQKVEKEDKQVGEHNQEKKIATKKVGLEKAEVIENKVTETKSDVDAKGDVETKKNVDKKDKIEIKEDIKTKEAKKNIDIQTTSTDGKYTFKYDGEDEFVRLKVPKDEWNTFIKYKYYKKMPNQKARGMTISLPWTQFIYENVADDYDFIIYVLNTEDRPQKLFMNGCYQGVKNDIIGIGTPSHGEALYDYTKQYSEHANKLQGIIFLTHNDVIYDGPILHELMHRWGNYIIDCDYGICHWGDSNIYGRLGGYKGINKIENNSNILSYKRYWSGPYAPFELYLMGLISKEEVPDITIMEDYSNRVIKETDWNRKDGKDMLVKGDIKTQTYTIEEIINGDASNKNQLKNIGERIPNYKDAQKDFNILFVTIDYDEVTIDQKQSINDQIKQLSLDDSYDDGVYNFWEACKGKAVIKTDINLAN